MFRARRLRHKRGTQGDLGARACFDRDAARTAAQNRQGLPGCEGSAQACFVLHGTVHDAENARQPFLVHVLLGDAAAGACIPDLLAVLALNLGQKGHYPQLRVALQDLAYEVRRTGAG